jgi:hypothetical protein
MNHRADSWGLLGAIIILTVVILELGPKGMAAPPPQTLPPNVHVINTPDVNIANVPTVRIQGRNWQYVALVIPKAFPGTPEWNEFIAQLNNYGEQGWELVNIVETVALMKKSI